MDAGEARRLSPEHVAHWRAYLRGSALLRDALSHDVENQAGLSLNEYEVLLRLSEAPDGTVRMSALADDLVHSRSRLTHTVHRMEARGLVERRSCSDDGRGVNCVLTPLGRQVLADATPGHVASVRAYLIDVVTPEELATIGRAMGRVADRLQGGPGGTAHASWLKERTG